MPFATTYRNDVQRILQRLRNEKLRIHIPGKRELHRKRPNSHFHATPELFIQTGGATDFDCAGEKFRLNAGDVCVMPRGVPHAETPRNLKTPYSIIVCMDGRENLFIHRARLNNSGHMIAHDALRLTSVRSHDIFRYLDNISDLDHLPSKYRKAYIRALLEAFFIAVCSALSEPRKPEPKTDSPLVSEAEQFVHTHLGSHN